MNTSCRIFVSNVISLTHPSQLLQEVTYKGVNINEGNLQAKYEKEKAQEDNGLLPSRRIGMNEQDDDKDKECIQQGKIDREGQEALDGVEKNLFWHGANVEGRK